MDNTKAGYLEGIISVIVNSVLFILKFWAGIVTGSIALTADAWHTLSDSLSSIIVIIAVKLSSKKPDNEHPFGHGRWEQIAAIFIAFLLGIIGFDFLKDSVYLQEKAFELEQETRFLLEDIREAAKIFVVKKKTPEHEPDILPF